jgi:hypothetical protein
MRHLYENDIETLRKRGKHLEIVRDYRRYMRIRDDFVHGKDGFKTPFLIIVGNPGVGKSQQFKNIDDTKYVDNAASAVGLYRSAFLNRRRSALILDDIDGLLFDDSAISLLKALGNTDPVKSVHWQKQNQSLIKEGISLQFETALRLCLLVNECPKASATRRGMNVGALVDRVTDFIFFLPTAEEVHGYTKTWIPLEHEDVYHTVEKYMDKIAMPSCRWYIRAIEQKKLGRDWRTWLREQLSAVDPVLWVFSDILNESNLDVDAKIAAFEHRTGLKSTSYYEYKKSYDKLRGKELI